jgi:hypothetical protein
MRTLNDYREANASLGYSGVSLFTQFSTFSGPQMFSLEEMHLLCRGVSSQLLQILTVDLSANNTKFFHKYESGDFEVGDYPFYIPRLKLKEIGQQIEKSRQFIPVAFDGAFQDVVQKVRGTRAVDYLDIALVCCAYTCS